MTHSNLTSYVAHSPNHYNGRSSRICKFTPHHMAGALTVEGCGSVFASSSRQASSNYGIGGDGRVACYVEEEDAAWTSSNYANDNMAITVEVANTPEGVRNGTWEVSDAAWKSLVRLAVDVCRRYGFRLSYDGTPNGSLTEHRMFSSTSCPGPYLHARMGKLAKEVNAILDGQSGSEDEEMLDQKDANEIWRFTNNGKQSGAPGTAWQNLMDTNKRVQKIEAQLSKIAKKLDALAKR